MLSDMRDKEEVCFHQLKIMLCKVVPFSASSHEVSTD